MIGDSGIVIVTGTDTGVGKTVVTAALAARAVGRGLRVAVVKPAQTGTEAFAPGERADADEVVRLAGPVTAVTLAEYPEPLAPLAAAEVAAMPTLSLDDVVTSVKRYADHDLVLVEGAGGLLVPMGTHGWTVADLAGALGAPAVVVARAGLGTLNHTALTLEALDRRGIPAAVVIGSWPAVPGLVHERNRLDLPGDVVGRVPEGAGRLAPADFRDLAAGWFSG